MNICGGSCNGGGGGGGENMPDANDVVLTATLAGGAAESLRPR